MLSPVEADGGGPARQSTGPFIVLETVSARTP